MTRQEGGFYVPLSTLHQPGYGEEHSSLSVGLEEEVGMTDEGGRLHFFGGCQELHRMVNQIYSILIFFLIHEESEVS